MALRHRLSDQDVLPGEPHAPEIYLRWTPVSLSRIKRYPSIYPAADL